jgi:hypothetical protein
VKAAAAALVAVTAATAGCGGGHANDHVKASYIAQADRICQTAKARTAPLVDQLVSAASGTLTPAQARKLAGVADRLHALGAAYVARLGRLKQPSSDRDTVQLFLDRSRQVVDSVGRGASALRAGNVTGALALLENGVATADQANAAARDYGFRRCESVLPSR